MKSKLLERVQRGKQHFLSTLLSISKSDIKLVIVFFSPECCCVLFQVFVHGEDLDDYFKEFDSDLLPADFDGKASIADYQAIATKLFGSEDTAL